MEEVSWIFNGDFEQRLFERRITNIQSTKITQEFEYFIHLLNPDYTIFSNKIYSNEYKEHLLNLTGSHLKINSSTKKIYNWCGDYSQIDLKIKLQDKVELSKFLINKGLLKERPSFISNESELEEGYLYKYPKSLSGGGHYFYPQNEKRLKKLLNSKEILIKEKVHKRYMDFSALIDDGKLIRIYKNTIDEYFQYKGTLIEEGFSLGEFKNEYERLIQEILNYTNGYNGIFSIDSFLYLNQAKKFLYPACELNIRKTMGYVAHSLKANLFKDSRVFKMLLMKNNFKNLSYLKIKENFGNNVILVSPLNNKFLVFLIGVDSKDDLTKVERELDSTFL